VPVNLSGELFLGAPAGKPPPVCCLRRPGILTVMLSIGRTSARRRGIFTGSSLRFPLVMDSAEHGGAFYILAREGSPWKRHMHRLVLV